MNRSFSPPQPHRLYIRGMLRRYLAALAAFACLSGGAVDAQPKTPRAGDWEIGPVIRGRNHSPGLPPRPEPLRDGWYFDFPAGSEAAGHVHYVTFRPGSLRGKSRITVRYRVDAAPGARFVARANPELPAAVSLYFQQRGDDWSGRGRYEFFRWYAPAATVRPIAPGEHEMTVAFDAPGWISVMGKAASRTPGAMDASLDDVDRVGLVFGAVRGRGHGVFATRPARFTLLGFRID